MVDLSPSAPPAETKEQREARLRAEAQANARNTKALQTNLGQMTDEFLRRFGLNAALAGVGSPISSPGFSSTAGGPGGPDGRTPGTGRGGGSGGGYTAGGGGFASAVQ